MTRLTTAGDFPFDMLLDPDQSTPGPCTPFASVAPAGQPDDPCLDANSAKEVCVMFATPVTPRYDHDEIQLVDTTKDDTIGDTEMSKDT